MNLPITSLDGFATKNISIEDLLNNPNLLNIIGSDPKEKTVDKCQKVVNEILRDAKNPSKRSLKYLNSRLCPRFTINCILQALKNLENDGVVSHEQSTIGSTKEKDLWFTWNRYGKSYGNQ